MSLDDVDLPENAALEMWRTIEARALAAAAAVVTVRGVVRAVPLP